MADDPRLAETVEHMRRNPHSQKSEIAKIAGLTPGLVLEWLDQILILGTKCDRGTSILRNSLHFLPGNGNADGLSFANREP